MEPPSILSPCLPSLMSRSEGDRGRGDGVGGRFLQQGGSTILATNTNLPFDSEPSSLAASVDSFDNGATVEIFRKKTFAACTTRDPHRRDGLILWSYSFPRSLLTSPDHPSCGAPRSVAASSLVTAAA